MDTWRERLIQDGSGEAEGVIHVERIVGRMQMIGGSDDWIQPTVDFVRKEMGSDDIRQMIAYVLDGRERTTSGEYFDIIRASSKN